MTFSWRFWDSRIVHLLGNLNRKKGTIEDETDEIVCFKAVIELNYEGMIEHLHDRLLVFYDVFLLIFTDESF